MKFNGTLLRLDIRRCDFSPGVEFEILDKIEQNRNSTKKQVKIVERVSGVDVNELFPEHFTQHFYDTSLN